MNFLREIKIAFRSLWKTKGLTLTVILTLALGIGANAAIFTLIRGVLLRPLTNRGEDRLIYIRQSAPGIGTENTTFSVPEINDIRSQVKTIGQFGDFSTIGFTMLGLGEPREVRAGVVGGSYFDVMGLRPVMGRLIGPQDDGAKAAGAVVLTYRFWTTVLKNDPNVLGKTVRLGPRTATVIGVLEPTVPYPADTEIIANIVTSPHHLSATMVTGRVHRMTQLFGRLAPGADLNAARAELRTVYARMVEQHPEAYARSAGFRIDATMLRDQITSKARTILLVLMAASGLVFLIACSNVANLVLARTMRREGELSMRAALGASAGTLRRMLLAESLVLCGTGAALGVVIAAPMVGVLARYASRFSVRALDLKVDPTMLWVGAILAIIAAVLLAYVPRLPAGGASHGIALSGSSLRMTGASRKQRIFAVTQIAASFMLLAGASMLLKTLIHLQEAAMPFDMPHVLAINVPVVSYGRTPEQVDNFYKETIRRVKDLPGVGAVALGTAVPWRDAGQFGFGLEFSGDGHVRAPGEEDPRARFRIVSPGFFAALGVPMIAGRDFNDLDRKGGEPVVIVSQSLAQRMFPNGDAVNRHVMWTDPVIKFIDVSPQPRRIVGVAADVDDENVLPGPTLTIYHPIGQEEIWTGRLFVHTRSDPHPLIPRVTRIIHDLSTDQPVEHAATLQEIRTEVLTSDRLNTLVFTGFAAVALIIAIIGVTAVLAFSVSGRTREFGIRLAIGSQPNQLMKSVLAEGAAMAGAGILAGAIVGLAFAKLAGTYLNEIQMAGATPTLLSAVLLLMAAAAASLVPAARAARVDVMQALRME